MGIRIGATNYDKTPDEILYVEMDLSGVLATGAVIQSIDVAIDPSGELTDSVGDRQINGQKINLRLSSGTAGSDYKIEVEATADNGEKAEGVAFVVVRDPA